MDMPTPCPECNDVVEFNDMQTTVGRLCYHNFVCQDCFENLESDEE
jgi:hypothetical protein